MNLMLMLGVTALLYTITAGSLATSEYNYPALTTSIIAASALSTSTSTSKFRSSGHLKNGISDTLDTSTAPLSPDEADFLFAYLLEKRGFDSKLLVTYDLRCDTSYADRLPRPAGPAISPYAAPAWMLRECQGWWACNTAGEIYQKVGQAPRKQYNSWAYNQYQMCLALCKCVIVDKPWWHYAENYGCVKPKGGFVMGGIGMSSRENDRASVDVGDGFSMQAHNGPARKMEKKDEGTA